MPNIFHEIKKGFLIVGFTGPLSSGCSTSANFFSESINEYIDKKTTDALPRVEQKIRALYKQISKLKYSLNIEDKKLDDNKLDEKKQNITKIDKLTENLKEYLHLRETLTVLKDYRGKSDFKHISMTEILLKITLENLILSNDDDLNSDFKILKSQVSFDKNKFKIVLEVNKYIENRELYKIDEGSNSIFEEFLGYVSSFRKIIKVTLGADRIGELLQDLGDNARRCGNPIDYKTDFDCNNAKTLVVLSNEANNIIKFFKNKKRLEFEGKKNYRQFVIEAFRNPYEVEYFRNRYYEFYLFSLFTPVDIREKRPNWNSDRDKRDQGRDLGINEFFKQNVSKCVHLSDIAINNLSSKTRLKQYLLKYFALICRPGCISPSSEEMFMQQAYSMSVKSNCISRQVGAVIVGPKGYIVGAGWNDVGSGQTACGLRKFKDLNSNIPLFPVSVKGDESDFNDFIKSNNNNPNHSFCFKDEYSRYKTFSKFYSSSSLNEWVSNYEVDKEGTKDLSSLIVDNFSPKRLEYCRALHAEENAILQSSILGGNGVEGGTIYTTTFPCELCAKKIYQSKIKKVIYTEPYPGSISEDVFFKDGAHYIELIQFQGVRSHSFYRLYKATVDQKEFQIQEKLYQ